MELWVDEVYVMKWLMSYSHRRLGKLVHTGRPDDCHYHATIVSPLQRARYSSSLQLISALLNQSRFTRANFISLVWAEEA